MDKVREKKQPAPQPARSIPKYMKARGIQDMRGFLERKSITDPMIKTIGRRNEGTIARFEQLFNCIKIIDGRYYIHIPTKEGWEMIQIDTTATTDTNNALYTIQHITDDEYNTRYTTTTNSTKSS